jgi:tripartite-type tricarboxylate transporter receptor subunit TctC
MPSRSRWRCCRRSTGSGRILALQNVKERMLTQGATSHPTSPEEFDAFIKDEVTRFRKIIKEAGIRVD